MNFKHIFELKMLSFQSVMAEQDESKFLLIGGFNGNLNHHFPLMQIMWSLHQYNVHIVQLQLSKLNKWWISNTNYNNIHFFVHAYTGTIYNQVCDSWIEPEHTALARGGVHWDCEQTRVWGQQGRMTKTCLPSLTLPGFHGVISNLIVAGGTSLCPFQIVHFDTCSKVIIYYLCALWRTRKWLQTPSTLKGAQ